jgi:ribonuclease HI
MRRAQWSRLADRAAKGERQDFVGLQPVDIRATTSIIRKEEGGGAKRRTLEMLITGAIPTWQRCVKHHLCPIEGFAPPTSDRCPFCRCGAVENMTHLLWECQAWNDQRAKMRSELITIGIREEELPKIAKEQGIIFEDMDLVKWRKETVTKEWDYAENPMPDCKKEGGHCAGALYTEAGRMVVFTDGSCLGQDDGRVRSAGCGVYVADNHAWNTAFSLPGIVQSSELGEARAALHTLEAATAQGFDVEIRLDNLTVVDTLTTLVGGGEVEYEKGKEIWQRAKDAVDKRKADGGVGHTVVWIPGHTEVSDVTSGRITEDNRNGNCKVDMLAKKGAASNACPPHLAAKAKRRLQVGKVLQEGLASILLRRTEVMKSARAVVGDEEEEPEDPWQTQRDRLNKFGLVKVRKTTHEVQAETLGDDMKEEAAMRARWPDFVWQQVAAAFTLSRGEPLKGVQVVFDAEFTKALRWYWSQLWWRPDAAVEASELGVSWKELAIDFWAATGIIARFPRNRCVRTTLQHMAEAFASASRALEKEETALGGWVWRGKCGRTSSLAPFGQKAAVSGLSVRPRLLHCVEVGFHLCLLAASSVAGGGEEEVERWRRRGPPSWRRWRRVNRDSES